MSSFGEELKRERELRDISLKEISEATKISIRFLEALEQDNFDILPGGVFNRGFIRAYARFIGIDGEEMVNAYLHELSVKDQRRAVEGREAAPPVTSPGPLSGSASGVGVVRAGRTGRTGEGYLEGIRSESLAGLRARDASAPAGRRAVLGAVEGRTSAALWALAVIAFLVGAGMITLNVLQRASPPSPPDAHAQAARARQARLAKSASGAALEDPSSARPDIANPETHPGPVELPAAGPGAIPGATSPDAPSSGATSLPVAPWDGVPPSDRNGADRSMVAVPAAPPIVEHRIWVRATEATQVTIQCAGRIVLQQELWPGLERRLDCAEPVVLGATNAGALLYSIDGGPAGLLGDVGEEARGVVIAPPPEAPVEPRSRPGAAETPPDAGV